MKNYKHFILMVVLSFLVIVSSNPLVADAASSSGGISFVFYLPLGILAAAVLAWLITTVEKVVKRKN